RLQKHFRCKEELPPPKVTTPNAPVTWGQTKSLPQQAECLLEQQEKKKTPENLLTAFIACLNANSCVMLCIMPWPPP
uniref:Uncharacterized protein n=1 Tax=Gopherus agassizii TaxID=38772 RepID=A0A452I7S3_9SAUR